MRKSFRWVVLSIVIAAVSCRSGGVATKGTAPPTRDATVAPAPTGRLGGDDLLDALRAGGYVMYFRHAATNSTPDDADLVDFSECGTQRNLSREGRGQSRAIGRAIDELGIPIGRVLSSPFCRALDTARLAFGRATSEQLLENLETSDTQAERDRRTRGLRRLLSTVPSRATNDVLVAHGFNITAAADVSLAEGAAAIFRPDGRDFEFVATIAPDEWRVPQPAGAVTPSP